jgi:hypothetical protein
MRVGRDGPGCSAALCAGRNQRAFGWDLARWRCWSNATHAPILLAQAISFGLLQTRTVDHGRFESKNATTPPFRRRRSSRSWPRLDEAADEALGRASMVVMMSSMQPLSGSVLICNFEVQRTMQRASRAASGEIIRSYRRFRPTCQRQRPEEQITVRPADAARCGP